MCEKNGRAYGLSPLYGAMLSGRCYVADVFMGSVWAGSYNLIRVIISFCCSCWLIAVISTLFHSAPTTYRSSRSNILCGMMPVRLRPHSLSARTTHSQLNAATAHPAAAAAPSRMPLGHRLSRISTCMRACNWGFVLREVWLRQ